jgi:outer membrane protein assembly factor BamB
METMNCRQIRDQLALWAAGDGSRAERAVIEAHLAACPACRDAARDYCAVVAEVRAAAAPTAVSTDTVRRMQTASAEEIRTARRRAWTRRALRLGAALAATVVLGVAVGYFVRGPARDEPTRAGRLERWRYEDARAERTSPADGVVVRGDRLYAVRRGEAGGAVVAIDAAAGRPLWESPLAGAGHLAADEARVYCVTAGPAGPELVALDTADGRPAWRYREESARVGLRPAQPVPLAAGRVAWTVGGTVHLLDAASGRPLWSRAVPGEALLSSVSEGGDGLLVAGCRALYGLDGGSGAVRWREAFDGAFLPVVRPLLAVGGGRAFVAGAGGGRAGRLVCLDRATRRVVWARPVPQPRHLLATADRVYLRGPDVRALAAGSGEAVWTHPADGCGPLTCSHGLVQFVDSGRDGRLLALDARTGRTAWEVPGLRSCCAVATAGDTGYVKTWDGVVHAIALRTR